MKKCIAFFTLLLLFNFSLKSQTSIEEYNYVIKGYKAQVIDQGGDLKKNYELENIDKLTVSGRTVELRKLLKVDGKQKIIVAYMLIYQKDLLPKEYICVPQPNSEEEVLDLFWKVLYNNPILGDGTSRLQIILTILTRQLIW